MQGINQLQGANSQKLKYRIIYCSGEDQDYPVTELIDNNQNTRGWQSQKFCDYPQEIIVQFPSLVTLKQLQFLSHQSKIASKIELFTFLPNGQQAMTSQIPLNEIEFKRLGYLSLDPNERSGFQARELKSVYVESNAVLLKFIFHKCHMNNFNVFNQIGLIAINCIGEPISSTKQAEASLPSKSYQYPQKSIGHNEMDPETQKQIKLLQQLKEEAVKNENFDQAKQLKESIDKLMAVSQQLLGLEEQKKMAIEQEDFDLAKNLKQQINFLRQTAASNHQGNSNITSYPQVKQEENIYQMHGIISPTSNINSQMNSLKFNNDFEKQNKEEFSSKSTKSTKFQDNPSFEPQVKPQPKQFVQQKQKAQVNVDDMIIPAITGGQGDQMTEYPEGQEAKDFLDTDAEPLSQEDMKASQPLIDIFGEQVVRKLFSKTWQFREEALNIIEEEAVNNGRNYDSDELFVNSIGAVRFTIQDKMAQVLQRSIQLVQSVCECYPQVNFDSSMKTNFNIYSDVIISNLIDKIADNLQKVRQKAEDALIALCAHPQFGIKLCLQYLISETTAPQKNQPKGKKPVVSNKLLKAKYELLRKLLMNFDFQYEQQVTAVKFCVKGIQNAQSDVRTPAYECMGELYKFMGMDEMSKYYQGLRQASLDALMAKFQEIDERQGKPLKQEKKFVQEQKVTIETNIGNKKGNQQKKVQQQQQTHQHQNQEQEIEKTCNFCGIYNQNFTEESLDIHYWRDCPMLTCCWECDQVVEIKSIEEHLLEECKELNKYMYHPKCKQVLLKEEVEGHECKEPLPKGAVKCPLCSTNVFPNNNEGWKVHLMEGQCQGNPRNQIN